MRPEWRAPARLRARWLAALSTVVAEGGHLAAAVIEWPTATARGVFHVGAAAVLGLVAVAVYFGPNRLDLGLGLAATLLLPAGWLIGTVAGTPPYRAYPLPAAVALTAVEIATAALLATHWPAQAPAAKRGRTVRVTARNSAT